MPSFRSDIVDIAYEVSGEGPPVLLIHGFASNARVNWIDTGWVKSLNEVGYQTITFDNRGHGESGKLYDPAGYPAPEMAEDARRLVDHLGLPKVRVMGYSMGARIAAFLTLNHPERVIAAVLSGLAENMIRGVGGAEPIARALEAPSADSVTDPSARTFRVFAEQTKGDLKALAACMRASRQKITLAELGQIHVPVLVVAGEMDEIAGKVDPLVAAIPGARGVTLARRNHMNAVGDRQHKEVVISFLNSIN
ncbi:alpha/beta hydrolase [Nordella sp. HKS 07]|uniref:alpha/beta fold hydrolase n=1 Tax=Nordella sp. HKS 07 TaxID=2712222 RepID=UPI0013E0FC60|nr:alpha/beta hydrolase [Nordella sp. HKS 07]QIG51615.1 alpha/beta hydrolase [Nordella sp. HKS 07]